MAHTLDNVPGLGTQLKMKITGTFTAVGQRVEIKTSGEVGKRNVTDLDATVEKYRPTLPDLGTLSLSLFFDPNNTVHALARARALTPSATLDDFQLIYPDGGSPNCTDAFKGFITKWEQTGMKKDDTLQADVEIQITDSYTVTGGTFS